MRALLFNNASGRVRAGWVIAAFACIAGLTELTLNLMGSRYLRAPLRLDQWRLLFITWPTFFAAVIATTVCVKGFSEESGLQKPATFWVGAGLGASALLLASVIPSVVGGNGTLGAPQETLSTIASSGVLQLLTIAPTSIGEELLFRGLAFRVLSRATHPLLAILLSSLIFGAVHLLNPHASLVAASNVALVGVWFGLVAWRISLWASIGLHVSWNWFEGFVFGQPVSGIAPGASLLSATWPSERSFWSGGNFGPEASGWTTVILLFGIVATVLIIRPKPENHTSISQ